MHIQIDTTQELSSLDQQICGLLAGKQFSSGQQAPAETKAPPAAKKAAAPARAAEPEPAEDLVGGGEATVGDAVARATKVIADGGQVAVKAALTDVGAARVSTLEQEQVAGFLAALDAAGV